MVAFLPLMFGALRRMEEGGRGRDKGGGRERRPGAREKEIYHH